MAWRQEDDPSIQDSRECRSTRTCSSSLSPFLTSALQPSTSGTTETAGCECHHLHLSVPQRMRCRHRLRTNPLPVSVFHCSYHSRGGNFVKSEKYFFINFHFLLSILSRVFFIQLGFQNYHGHSYSFPQPQLRHFKYDAVYVTVFLVTLHSQGPQIITNVLQIFVFNIDNNSRSKYYYFKIFSGVPAMEILPSALSSSDD